MDVQNINNFTIKDSLKLLKILQNIRQYKKSTCSKKIYIYAYGHLQQALLNIVQVDPYLGLAIPEIIFNKIK